MKHKGIWFYLAFLLGISSVYAQVAPDCGNAIPICNNTPVNGGTMGFGTDDFNGALVSGCLEDTTTGVIESNSAWYRFRTGASGQLGFNIGFDTSEDWDFALYRTSDCNVLGEPVRCNFFDNQDQNAFIGVGEDPTGPEVNVQYEDWLQVEPGEDYYLLINNFSNSNSGFSIQFSGNIFITNPNDALDCSIISNLLGPPISACENDIVSLDGTMATAIAYDWFQDNGSGFQSISGEHNPLLQVTTTGRYRVSVTLPDGSTIISDVDVVYSAMPMAYPLTDDASCTGATTYDLSQKDTEVLGGQDPTEFIVSYHTTMADANSGANILPKLLPSANNSQTIYVRVSSINNPRCYDATQQFQLTNLESPMMDFGTEVYLCAANSSVTIGETSPPNQNYTYLWDTGQTTSSLLVTQAGTYTVTATNAQGGLNCSDSRTITVTASVTPMITDVIIEDLQKNNTVTIMTNVTDHLEFQLNDGDFQSSNIFVDVPPGIHTVTVNDINGCGTVTERIVVVGFPKFFTPNGDNSNDQWHIVGISELENPVVHIYDRFGKLVKQLNETDLGWNGQYNGNLLPSSDYWFTLSYTDTNGQRSIAKYINNHFSLKR